MEEIFDLREFIITILRKWRLIVVFALVLGVFGAGYKLLPALLPTTESPEAQEEFVALQSQYEQELEFVTAGIRLAQTKFDNKQKYSENSPLLKLDEYNSYQGTVGYYVVSNEPVLPETEDQNLLQAEQMKEMYLHLLTDIGLYQSLAKAYGEDIDPNLMREMVLISRLDGNLFQLVLFADSAEMCERLLTEVERYLAMQTAKVSNAVGTHSLTQISKTVEMKLNATIQAVRTNTLNEASALNTSLVDQNKKLKELAPPSEPGGRVSKKSVLKFGLIGAAGGCGLAIVVIFFLDMMNSNIASEEELRKNYGLTVFGCVSKRKGGA